MIATSITTPRRDPEQSRTDFVESRHKSRHYVAINSWMPVPPPSSRQDSPRMSISESTVEDAALAWLAWLAYLGYSVLHGPDIAPGEPAGERSDPGFRDVILAGRFHQALVRLNPDLPHDPLEDAYRKLTHTDAPGHNEEVRV